MACKNPRLQWVKNRLHVLTSEDKFPGVHVPGEYRGFINGGMHDGAYLKIDCRVCPSCVVKYQNALIGSCLAETAYAESAVSITMTYANDAGSDTRSDLAHKMLIGGHVREFTERLRKARGFGRVRYLVAGEYGPLYGRAHWHAVLIFEDGMPPFDFSAERYNDNRLWPYGFISAKPCEDEAGFAYACKYAVKSTKAMQDNPHYMPGVETVMRRSRIPPLGQPFFLERAVEQADFGIPLSMKYLPPGGLQKANYHVRGLASRLRMAHAYLDRLAESGHDVAYFQDKPLGYRSTGLPIPRSADPDICRLVETACRERRLAALPLVTLEQEFAATVADFADRQVRQERVNAAVAARREAAAVKRAKERNREFALSFRNDPSDPYWDDFDADRHAFSLLRGGAWRSD